MGRDHHRFPVSFGRDDVPRKGPGRLAPREGIVGHPGANTQEQLQDQERQQCVGGCSQTRLLGIRALANHQGHGKDRDRYDPCKRQMQMDHGHESHRTRAGQGMPKLSSQYQLGHRRAE